MNEDNFWNNPMTTSYFSNKPPDPRIVSYLEANPVENGQRALDLGCGSGRHTEVLAGAGFNTFAVDVNRAMIQTTKNRIFAKGLTANVTHGSITDIPFPDGTFDLIVATGVLHQAKNISEYLDALEELSRVSRPNARVLLNVFTNVKDDTTFVVISDDGRTVKTKEGLVMTLIPSKTLVDMMRKVGFTLIESQGEKTKLENTGPRTTYRAFFEKRSKRDK